jgi:parallel beta helix pectate lyase-like protein
MTLVRRSLALGVVATTFVAGVAVTAQAATIQVFKGDSIQDAVDSAHRGDTIVVHQGIFRGGVKLKKNQLTLRGAGDGKNGSVIKPGRHNNCGGGAAGVCVGSRTSHGNPIPTVGATVRGFRVQGFRDFGAIAFNATKTTFRDDTFARNDEYGAAAFSSRKTKFVNNVAMDGKEAGFYVGDSPHAKAVLRDNVAKHNRQFGFFLRDSSHARAVHNKAVNNCLGMGLINTGSPGGVHDWAVKRNHVLRNNRRCPGSGNGPPISGTGIGLLGASHNAIQGNIVNGNRPSGGSAFPGGIVVASSAALGGSNSAHNLIVGNRARGNQPADILWDGKGKGNAFKRNHCGSSQPAGLCQ